MLAVVSLLAASTPVRSAETQTFVPSGRWTANGESGRCTLTREFTGGVARLTLSIEPLPFSDDVDLTLKVLGEGGRYKRVSSRVSFDVTAAFVKRDTESFTTSDGIHHVLRLRLRRNDFDRAATSEILNVTADNDLNARIQVPKLIAGLNILDRCIQTIANNVGLSPTQVTSIAQNSVPPPVLRKLSSDEIAMLNKGDLEDEAIARYIVGADGKATECGLVHPAADQNLNQRTCILMHPSPLRFTPAKDHGGKSVPGVVFERVRWFRL